MPRLARAQRKDLHPDLPQRRLTWLQHHHSGIFFSLPLMSEGVIEVELRLNRDKRSIERGIPSHRLDRRAQRDDSQTVVVLWIPQLSYRPIFHQPGPQVNKTVVEIQSAKLRSLAACEVVLGSIH